MNALVTGGTGFIGSSLVKQLRQRGDRVTCVAKDPLNSAYVESLGAEVVIGDLNNGMFDRQILSEAELVLHLAGVTRARWSREYYRENFLATRRFVTFCLQHCRNLRRFVYVSSLTAVGPSPDGEPLSEASSAYHPVSTYGKSKMLGELEVLRAAGQLPVTVIRPSAVYGPRERDLLEYFKIIRKGFQPMIGFGKKYLNIVHVDDLARGILLASDCDRAVGETYFLGSELQYTTEQIGTAIASALGRIPRRLYLPHAAVYAVGTVAGAVGKLFHRQILFNLQKARESTQRSWVCSVAKAKEHFGYSQHLSLEQGMEQTYLWYKEHGWLP